MAWFAGAVATAVVFAGVSCGGSDDEVHSSPRDGGSDSALVGEVTPPALDAEGVPENVCGNRDGLQLDSAWPLRGGCPTRAGWSSVPGPQSSNVHFSVPAAGGESSPVVAADGVLWVGTSTGEVLAVSASDGVVRWSISVGMGVRSSPAITSNGVVVVGGGDGKLYGLANGDHFVIEDDAGNDAEASPLPAKVVFSLHLGPVTSSPVIGGDGTIYVGATDGKLVAVAGDGSAVKWSAVTNDTLGSSPAMGQDGTIYVGSSDHHLYAIADGGRTKWALDLGSAVRSSPVVGGDGTVYAGTENGTLHAVDPFGKVRWVYATGGAITGSAVHGDTVYVGSEDRSLHAVSVVEGSRRWAYATLGAVATPVIGSDGVIYVASTDAHLYAITSKGSLFFAVNLKGGVKSAPAIADGAMLYVTTENGIVAIGP